MIDINIIREDREKVKENLRKKFQEDKVFLVNEIYALDQQFRDVKQTVDELRMKRNKMSSEIGVLMREGKKEEAEKRKAEVTNFLEKITELEEQEKTLSEQIKQKMYNIPNFMAEDVPIGKDDSENVELATFGEKPNYDFPVPYHVDILENLNGLDLEAARKVAGHGFYYLLGDVARLHSAILTYARDFMINKGFEYCIPPYMIRGEMVDGVMSFSEREAMMYKVENSDLYLIGTSEHSMISMFKDSSVDIQKLPKKLTSYSPCFRREKGAHGIEERGIFRIHQFEKQEMIVVCHPNESAEWYDKMWQYTVDFFLSLNIPVRTLECCSGDLADLKHKSVDVEAWSPRQEKYFEVGSCSNLTDAQSRRLGIKIKDGKEKYYAHTLNNTVVAPPRMLIALIENNLNADGSVNIPAPLIPYMDGLSVIKNEK